MELLSMIPDGWMVYVNAFLVILGALVTIASAIVPFTKTPKDDAVLEKVKAFIQRFSLIKPKS